jgi:cell division protein FtsB
MAVLDDVPPGRSERIELAVQREMARRRRLLRLYLFLLLIPLGVGAWFLSSGSSDREAARQDIQKVEKSYAEIAPKIDQVKELDTVLPELRGTAQRIADQQAQVSTLAQSQDKLEKRLTSVATDLQSLAPKVKALAPSPEDLKRQRELAARLDDLAKNVKELRQGQDNLSLQQHRITADVEKLRLEKQPSPGLSTFDLQRLENRLRTLEQDNQNLRSEMFRLRSVRPPG